MRQTTNEYRCFLESNFVGVNKLFVLIYSNHDYDAKRYKARSMMYQKVLLRILMSPSIEITFMTNEQSLNNYLISLTINFY